MSVRTRPTYRAAWPLSRRLLIGVGWFYLAGLGAIGVMIALSGFTPASTRWLIGMSVLGVPLWVLQPFALSRDRKRIRRIVEDASGAACLRCGYELHGLGDAGACPECGEPFEASSNEEAWRRALGAPAAG